MSEQGITQDDERWIIERLRAGDMTGEIARAGIARGYERGQSEGAADRDRLAKRVQELGAEVERMKEADVANRSMLHHLGDEIRDLRLALDSRTKDLDATRRERDEVKRDFGLRVAPLVYDAVVADRDDLAAEMERCHKAIDETLQVPDRDTTGSTATLEDRVGALLADRERLAKRCEELDDELTQWQFSEVPPARLSVVESRQSATDARLTALAGDVARVVGALREYDYALDHPLRGLDGVEPTIACDDDLAALRAPGTSTLATIVDALVTDQNAEVAALTRERDALRRAVGEANGERDAARRERDQAREAGIREAAHASRAARERDEAVGVLAEVSARMMDDESLCWCASARLPGEDHQRACTRARALVAGEAGPSKLDAIMTEREAEIIGESFAAEPERAAIATLRASLAERDAEVADIRERCAFREQERDEARSDRDTLRARVAELEARDREGRWIVERAVDHAPHSVDSHGCQEWADRRDAYLSSAPIPDPARGLIERAVRWVEAWQASYPIGTHGDAILADLRAYLGGGT